MRLREAVLLAAVVVAALTAVLTFIQLDSAADVLETIRDQKVNAMQERVTEWKDEAGLSQKVRTVKNEEESPDEFEARHTTAVTKAVAAHPPA